MPPTLPPEIAATNALTSDLLSFDLTTILIGILFGTIGFLSWRYGRKALSERHMILGVGLMGYAYFVPNPWVSFIIGTVLTGLLFWP
jgi:hypothetical protein